MRADSLAGHPHFQPCIVSTEAASPRMGIVAAEEKLKGLWMVTQGTQENSLSCSHPTTKPQLKAGRHCTQGTRASHCNPPTCYQYVQVDLSTNGCCYKIPECELREQKFIFSVWKSGCPRSRDQQSSSLLRPPPWAGQGRPCRLFTWPLEPLLPFFCVLISSNQDTSQIGLALV